MAKDSFLTMVSVRLNTETLRAIDQYAARHQGFDRSMLINIALEQLFVNSTDEQIWTFLCTNIPIKK